MSYQKVLSEDNQLNLFIEELKALTPNDNAQTAFTGIDKYTQSKFCKFSK